MPITITKKTKPSNKPETHPTLNGPFIDKIAIIVMVDEEDQSAFYNAMWQCLDDDELFTKQPAKPIGGFKIARRINLPSIGDIKKLPSAHFDYVKHEKLLRRVRLEFVPVDLGYTGMAELNSAVTTFISGWDYVVMNGHVTRLDIAVDVGVKTGTFIFLPKQSATTTMWRFSGELQSYYSGKPSGNQTKIYNRQAKRLAKGQDFPDVSTRLERRLVGLKGMSLIDLPVMANPFADMKLLPNPLNTPPWINDNSQWEWTLFCDAIVVRGLSDALALLPVKKREQYRTFIKTQNLDWWEPGFLWKGWAKMLKELKICDPKF